MMPREGGLAAALSTPVPGAAAHLARVVSVKDPDGLARVQVRLLGWHCTEEAEIWARVAAPFAGRDRGAFLIPDVDDEVLVVFVNGDTRFPIVVGGLWNGAEAAPEQLGGAGERIDRWSLTGKAGTRIAIVEESEATATIAFETPAGVAGTLTDEGGGRIELVCGGSTVTIDPKGVTVETGGRVDVSASELNVTAGQVNVQTALARFSAAVQCETLMASTVVGKVYTPGPGNVW